MRLYECFFFFKQKTEYEVRISDWSSDVCSSDLLEAGRTVALANKEALVSAGALMMQAAKASGATLLPVDSEHNAIFQCLAGARMEDVQRITLTASGGPFRSHTREQMASVTPAQAVRHPNWSMGAKISVDSATMMNKGLELIEAHHLFPVGLDRIAIMVHPQSVIHSLVEFRDHFTLAQLGAPDMRSAEHTSELQSLMRISYAVF